MVAVRARVAGLVLNFLANAVLLYGLAGYTADGSRTPALVLGSTATLLLLFFLSRPAR